MSSKINFNLTPKMKKLKSKTDIHWERKITHIIGILFMTGVYYFSPRWVVWVIFCLISIPFMTLDILRFRSPKLKDFAKKLFTPIMRDREEFRLSGTTFLFLGAAIAIIFFPKSIATLSLLFLALADPLASIIGIKYGKKKLLGSHKTILGSLGAFFICVLISILYFITIGINPLINYYLFICLSGLIGALSEALAFDFLDDNFTQPVLNSILLYCLFYFGAPQVLGVL